MDGRRDVERHEERKGQDDRARGVLGDGEPVRNAAPEHRSREGGREVLCESEVPGKCRKKKGAAAGGEAEWGVEGHGCGIRATNVEGKGRCAAIYRAAPSDRRERL